MKKVYVSIPISGENYVDQKNHAFVVATDLGMKGYDVVTPFDLVKDVTTPYNKAMGICITALLGCDAICMCRGWENSRGCKAELGVALAYNKELMVE